MGQKAQSGPKKNIVKALRQPMEEKCTESTNDAADDKNDDIDGYEERAGGNEIGKRKRKRRRILLTQIVYIKIYAVIA